MKWISGVKEKAGTTRIVTKFLYAPLKIRGESRWLEKATWKEEVNQYVYINTGERSRRRWDKVCWID